MLAHRRPVDKQKIEEVCPPQTDFFRNPFLGARVFSFMLAHRRPVDKQKIEKVGPSQAIFLGTHFLSLPPLPFPAPVWTPASPSLHVPPPDLRSQICQKQEKEKTQGGGGGQGYQLMIPDLCY